MTSLSMSDALSWRRKTSTGRGSAACRPMRVLEHQAIVKLNPALNLRRVSDYPPPQMRRAAPPRKARAQWLWHMSWAGLLVGDRKGKLSNQERSRWRLDDPEAVFDVDRLGFPVPGAPSSSRHREQPQDVPDSGELWTLVADAGRDAPAAVRHALGRRMQEDELELWWAAHAAAPWLPNPSSVRDALAATLSLTPATARPGPRTLPSSERCKELYRLTTLLARIRH